MVKRAKNFDYNSQMDQLESMWLKGLKFTLPYNLKENFFTMMYHMYMKPNKLSKMYKDTFNHCWKCEKLEWTFYHT